MNRAIGVAVVAFGCGGSAKPVPVTTVAPPPPSPAAPPVEKEPVPEAPVVAKGGDPCDGGEIASRGGERTTGAGGSSSTGGLAGIGGAGGAGGVGAGAPGGGGLAPPPRDRNTPTGALRFGTYDFGPGLDTDGTKRVFSRNQHRLLYCYNTALQRDPSLSGTVMLDIAIEKSGMVSSAHAEGVEDGLDRCIQHGVTSFQLPAAKQRSHLTVRLIFTPP